MAQEQGRLVYELIRFKMKNGDQGRRMDQALQIISGCHNIVHI